jgi:hypothetical protein
MIYSQSIHVQTCQCGKKLFVAQGSWGHCDPKISGTYKCLTCQKVLKRSARLKDKRGIGKELLLNALLQNDITKL